MKLHNRKSYLNTQAEKSPARRSAPRITHWLYLAIVAAICVYILHFIISRMLFLELQGQVEVDKIDLGSVRGGRLSSVHATPGQPVSSSQQLAFVAPSRVCDSRAENTRLQKMDFDIEDQRLQLSGLQAELRLLQEQLQNLSEHRGLKRALELDADLLPASDRTRQQAMQLEQKIRIQEQYIVNLLQRRQLLVEQTDSPALTEDCLGESIVSPVSGQIYSVNFKAGEVVQRGDIIVTVIADNARVAIEAFPENKQLKSFRIGDTLEVEFADGDTSTANVAGIQSEAALKPNRLSAAYRPLHPELMLTLRPSNEQDVELWRRYDRQAVTVHANP